jgi:hypothetical protein
MSAQPFCAETIYAKLMFLSSVIGVMEKDRQERSSESEFAICVMLSDITKEIYPEWKDEKEETPV